MEILRIPHMFIIVKWLRCILICLTTAEFVLLNFLYFSGNSSYNFGQFLTNSLMSAVIYGPVSTGVSGCVRHLQYFMNDSKLLGISRTFSTVICAFLRVFFHHEFLSETPWILKYICYAIILISLFDNSILLYAVLTFPSARKPTRMQQFFLVDNVQRSLISRWPNHAQGA
uniref:Uncharacterized protein n=1 Tax=Panagrolaimus sp. PS1159 TaxID=55785 RepID=A0AC35GGZ1_9BILA